MSNDLLNTSRRQFLSVASASTAAAFFATHQIAAESAGGVSHETTSPETTKPIGMHSSDTAVVFIDPQNDVLSETGKAFDAVRESLKGMEIQRALETDEVNTNLFGRTGRLTTADFKGSGADWLERFKPYIEDGKTIVASPHRVWGPQTNDLVL
jgi:hypothetical protein